MAAMLMRVYLSVQDVIASEKGNWAVSCAFHRTAQKDTAAGSRCGVRSPHIENRVDESREKARLMNERASGRICKDNPRRILLMATETRFDRADGISAVFK